MSADTAANVAVTSQLKGGSYRKIISDILQTTYAGEACWLKDHSISVIMQILYFKHWASVYKILSLWHHSYNSSIYYSFGDNLSNLFNWNWGGVDSLLKLSILT